MLQRNSCLFQHLLAEVLEHSCSVVRHTRLLSGTRSVLSAFQVRSSSSVLGSQQQTWQACLAHTSCLLEMG